MQRLQTLHSTYRESLPQLGVPVHAIVLTNIIDLGDLEEGFGRKYGACDGAAADTAAFSNLCRRRHCSIHSIANEGCISDAETTSPCATRTARKHRSAVQSDPVSFAANLTAKLIDNLEQAEGWHHGITFNVANLSVPQDATTNPSTETACPNGLLAEDRLSCTCFGYISTNPVDASDKRTGSWNEITSTILRVLKLIVRK